MEESQNPKSICQEGDAGCTVVVPISLASAVNSSFSDMSGHTGTVIPKVRVPSYYVRLCVFRELGDGRGDLAGSSQSHSL